MNSWYIYSNSSDQVMTERGSLFGRLQSLYNDKYNAMEALMARFECLFARKLA